MPDGDRDRRRFCFGEFVLDVDRAALSRAGAELRLRPQSFEVLRFLVERAGRLVTRDELMAAVWAGRVVTDGALTQCIADIRRALGDDGPRIVRTVARRGFVFEAEVGPVQDGQPPPPAAAAGPAARRWAAPMAMIAAATVLLGIAVPVLRPGPPPEQAGQPTMGDASASPSAQAHGLYLRGRHLFDRRQPGDSEAAERHLRQALALDPSHARAWVLLAGVLQVRGAALNDPGYRLVEQAAALQRALQIDPHLAEAHVRLARFASSAGDLAARQAVLARAQQIAPDDPLVLGTQVGDAVRAGRHDEAITLLQRVVQGAPLSTTHRHNLGLMLLADGRYDDAIRELRSVVDLSPAKADSRLGLARALLLRGLHDEARQASLAVAEGPERDQLRVLLDDPVAGGEALRRLQADGSADGLLRLAELAAHRGDVDAAWERLDAAVAQLRAAAVNDHRARTTREAIQISPFLRPLRDDPRWGRW